MGKGKLPTEEKDKICSENRFLLAKNDLFFPARNDPGNVNAVHSSIHGMKDI